MNPKDDVSARQLLRSAPKRPLPAQRLRAMHHWGDAPGADDGGGGAPWPGCGTDGILAPKVLRHDAGDDEGRAPDEEEVEDGREQRVDHVSTSVRVVGKQ